MKFEEMWWLLWNFSKSKYSFLGCSKQYRSTTATTNVHVAPLLLLLKINMYQYLCSVDSLSVYTFLILRKTVISKSFQRCFRVDNSCQKNTWHKIQIWLSEGLVSIRFISFFVLNHLLFLIVNSFRGHHQPQMADKSHSLNIQLTAVIFFRHEECEIYYKSDSKIYFTRSR